MSAATAVALVLGVVVAPGLAALLAGAATGRTPTTTRRAGAEPALADRLATRPVTAAAVLSVLGGLLLVVVFVLAVGGVDRGYAVAVVLLVALLTGGGAAYALRQGEEAAEG